MIVKNQKKIGSYTYGTIDNEKYLQVFYHNVAGGYFDSELVKYSVNDRYRYSILSKVGDRYRGPDGNFTFALIYDEYNAYNVWTQYYNPLYDAKKNSDNKPYKVKGFRSITNLANMADDYCVWGGLVRSHTQEDTIIDGCPGGSDWFFAIGLTAKGSQSWDGKSLIPAFDNDRPAHYVSLWVKWIDHPETFFRHYSNYHFCCFVFIALNTYDFSVV